MKKVVDAEFEVITGPSPVQWQPELSRRRSGVLWYQWAFGGLIALLAAYVLLLGLAGADLDTRDSVEAWKDRQPVPAQID